MIFKKQDLNRVIEEIKIADVIALDFETPSLTDLTPIAFSIAYGDSVYFIPLRMKYFFNVSNDVGIKLLEVVCKHKNLVFHHFAFDGQVLRGMGIELDTAPHDTLILSHLNNENEKHGLKNLVLKYLDYKMIKYKELCGVGKKQITLADVQDKEKVELYITDDALYTLKLFNYFYPKIMQDENLTQAYGIEQPLLLVVHDMHSQGVPVNASKIKDIKHKCLSLRDDYKSKLDYYMLDVNLNSPKQLKEYFIGKKRLPVLKRSRKTNEPSVDAEVLQKYADRGSKEAGWILKYRYYAKIVSTFVPALTPDDGGLIHPHFHQVGTTSGRFSSSNPNFQNIPLESDLNIRDAIEAPTGFTFVGADYSQMELRLAAHFSGDENMCETFNTDKDIHTETANKVGCTRSAAKTINFGILYGMGVNTLAKKMGVDRQHANLYMHNYYQTYPRLQDSMLESKNTTFTKGYLVLLFGRKRRLPDNFEDQTEWQKGGILRSITNAKIQGSGAEIIKKAMVDMHEQLQKYEAHIIAQIHDEVIVMCREEYAGQVQKIVEDAMLAPTSDLSVPFKVDSKVGTTWAGIH